MLFKSFKISLTLITVNFQRNFPSNVNIETKIKLEAEINKSGAVLETKQFG